MADRETKKITTPGGRVIELRTYLTGREANQLKELLFADMKLNTADIESGKIAVDNIPASFLVKQEEKAIELLVVSLGGVTENAAQLVLDLPSADYDTVVEAVNEIRNPTTPEK
jgi:tartrate dehydratase alpha subunit/fumarate hydratase class I-like protein